MYILYLLSLIFFVSIVLWFIVENYLFKKSTYYKITKNGFLATFFDVGRYGEYLTYRKLKGYEKKGAKFLFNVYLPREKDETTEIDVLMIAPDGLYVFESKNYSGWIFGDEKSKTWTQTLPQGKKSRKDHFLNPIMQNKLHIKWLKNFLGEEDISVHSVIVFSERCTLKKVTVVSDEIKVVKRNDLVWAINKINANAQVVFNQEQINEIYENLYPCCQISEADKEKHIQQICENMNRKKDTKRQVEAVMKEEIKIESADVQEIKAEIIEENQDNNLEEKEKTCPRCGNKLILRVAGRGENKGKKFWGCMGFPKCRYIENIE